MKRLRVLTAAFGILLLTSPASGDDMPVSSFQAFEGRTDSYAAGLSSKQISFAPVPIEGFLTRTRTEVNSQPRAQAYAGVVDVPLGELASMFGFPGKLPNYCYADYPGEPDNTCAGDQGVTHAEGDGFNLDATRAESSVAGARHSDRQVTIGASYSHSASRIVDGVLENSTEVVLQQVKLGDALAFEQMRSSRGGLHQRGAGWGQGDGGHDGERHHRDGTTGSDPRPAGPVEVGPRRTGPAGRRTEGPGDHRARDPPADDEDERRRARGRRHRGRPVRRERGTGHRQPVRRLARGRPRLGRRRPRLLVRRRGAGGGQQPAAGAPVPAGRRFRRP